MNANSEPPADLATRVVAARERNRHSVTARELVAAGLIAAPDAVLFVGDGEVNLLMTRAHESAMQAGWRQRSGWDEVVPELLEWLERQGQVVSGLTKVVAGGSWFAERVTPLQRLWRDLYLYAPDGLSGYLVNLDSERGFETLTWGDQPERV
jgi:hypothetical protein